MEKNMLGAYGQWAASLQGTVPGELSLRGSEWSDIGQWRKVARAALLGLLHLPPGARASDIQVHRRYTSDGLDIEELSWQLPYGPRTQAFFLKPRGVAGRGSGSRGKLPAVLAFHDHGGNKYFGKRKIVRTDSPAHPMIVAHQRDYYGGVGWANEVARRGFAVLVHDVFPFESRKILASDMPGHVVERMMSPPDKIRELTPEDLVEPRSPTGLDVPSEEPAERIAAYNAFAGQHESIIAKCLFCAGLTWPGVTVAEDLAALDYLASRPDVDPDRISCAGLSLGGLRTALLAGLDDRIRAAVCVGFMTTWRDFLLATSYTHTWMIYVPGLPGLLDFPEILGLRAPLPTLVLATTEDPLFSPDETKRAAGMLREVFSKTGAPERLTVTVHPGPHKFDLPMQAEAFAWIEKWLG